MSAEADGGAGEARTSVYDGADKRRLSDF